MAVLPARGRGHQDAELGPKRRRSPIRPQPRPRSGGSGDRRPDRSLSLAQDAGECQSQDPARHRPTTRTVSAFALTSCTGTPHTPFHAAKAVTAAVASSRPPTGRSNPAPSVSSSPRNRFCEAPINSGCAIARSTPRRPARLHRRTPPTETSPHLGHANASTHTSDPTARSRRAGEDRPSRRSRHSPSD